jgi:hypothetical protein
VAETKLTDKATSISALLSLGLTIPIRLNRFLHIHALARWRAGVCPTRTDIHITVGRAVAAGAVILRIRCSDQLRLGPRKGSISRSLDTEAILPFGISPFCCRSWEMIGAT